MRGRYLSTCALPEYVPYLSMFPLPYLTVCPTGACALPEYVPKVGECSLVLSIPGTHHPFY
jgi:hypothetical protein